MDDARYFDRAIRGKRSADVEVAALATRQHGVVTRRQLRDLGLSADAIDRRLRAGRLHAVHRGVHAVGHRRLSREGRWMAAVLAGGHGAVQSHRSAGALWGVRPTARARIDVTVGRSRRRRPGIQFHRDGLAPDEITEHASIPATTPARTLLDLAVVIGAPALARAVEQAEILRLPLQPSLDELLQRYAARPGTPSLQTVTRKTGRVVTRSELEARFLDFLDDHGLPRPQVNARVETSGRTLEVDFTWPARRLAVELDGQATRATPTAFERDRARDRLLQTAGWQVIRITWRQLHEQPGELARDLAHLTRAGSRRSA